jgi:hypothetical protein
MPTTVPQTPDYFARYQASKEAMRAAARAALRRRASEWGASKRVARELGVSGSLVSSYISGKRNMPDALAARILADVRAEELTLADRIEAELYGLPLPPRRIPAAGWCEQCECRVTTAQSAACKSPWCKAKTAHPEGE